MLSKNSLKANIYCWANLGAKGDPEKKKQEMHMPMLGGNKARILVLCESLFLSESISYTIKEQQDPCRRFIGRTDGWRAWEELGWLHL